jgi:hypothetical protein
VAAVDPIRIEGLIPFQRALKEMDGESQKQLRVVFNRAADLVVGEASQRVPRRSGRAAQSIKARSGQREAVVVAGGNRAPHFPWLDFGGAVGKQRAVKRRFIKSGRYIYPAYSNNRIKVQAILEDGLAELVKSAGLEVS